MILQSTPQPLTLTPANYFDLIRRDEDDPFLDTQRQGVMPQPAGRRVLIIGGTGMLAPLCQAIPADDLILAARFQSNHAELKRLPKTIYTQPLDYRDAVSRNDFLKDLATWHDITWCVLWVHSDQHAFSLDVMSTLTAQRPEVHLLHVLGTQSHPSRLGERATERGITFSAVQLGDVRENGHRRWMTHKEISTAVGDVLAKTYPDLGEIGEDIL